MVCPECGCEYQDWAEQCIDCHVALVHESQREPEPRMDEPPEEYADLVPFKVFRSRSEAQLAKGFLASHGIESMLSFETIGDFRTVFKASGGLRLFIREADMKEAEAVFKQAGIAHDETQDRDPRYDAPQSRDAYEHGPPERNLTSRLTRGVFLFLLLVMLALTAMSLVNIFDLM